MARLEAFVALLHRWQGSDNLVAARDRARIWTRHVADSAELVRLMPSTRRWLDMGSGAGFPGVVVAILSGATVDLVESNRRKCAFLRQAIRDTGAPAVVHHGRAEDLLSGWQRPVDRISARALAPLTRLFAIGEPLMAAGTPAAFHKGRECAREIDEAAQFWDFDLVQHESRISGGGVILEVSRLRRRHPGQAGP